MKIKNKMNIYYKLTAIIVIICFLSQNIVWSQPSCQLSAISFQPKDISRQLLENINIPSGLGRISDTYQGNNGKTIIHIVDTHADYNVQVNYAQILEEITKQTQDNKILLGIEGAKGPIDWLLQ